MEHAIADLYHELRRLKATGTQFIYVDPQSIAALTASLNKQSQRYGEVPQLRSQHSTIEKPIETDLTHTVEAPLDERPFQTFNIQLPAGKCSEQLLWLEKQYNEKFNALRPEPCLFGSGCEQADILVCRYQGEAEGEKSQQRALLSKVFQAMELGQQSIYITHLVKCAPNEDPIASSVVQQTIIPNEHRPYLMAQIKCIQPKVILVLGKACHDALLVSDLENRFAKSIGQWRNLDQIPVMTSYDPNYLLQNDTLETKRQFWEDMLKILAKLKCPITSKQLNYFLPRTKG